GARTGGGGSRAGRGRDRAGQGGSHSCQGGPIGCYLQERTGRQPMKIKIWGARGSVPAPGPETMHYGGNTSCVEVTLSDGSTLILDAGTGIRNLGLALPRVGQPIHILLTDLHLDHIQGLMFFAPAFRP